MSGSMAATTVRDGAKPKSRAIWFRASSVVTESLPPPTPRRSAFRARPSFAARRRSRGSQLTLVPVARAQSVAQLLDGADLDLADALARDPHPAAQLIQRLRAAAFEAVALLHHPALSRAQAGDE